MSENKFPVVEPVEDDAIERQRQELIAAAVDLMQKAKIPDIQFILGYLRA